MMRQQQVRIERQRRAVVQRRRLDLTEPVVGFSARKMVVRALMIRRTLRGLPRVDQRGRAWRGPPLGRAPPHRPEGPEHPPPPRPPQTPSPPPPPKPPPPPPRTSRPPHHPRT